MDEGFDGDGLLINKKPPHDFIYDGNWKDGKMHGFGKLKTKIMKKGQYYEGHFKDNKKDGLVSSEVQIVAIRSMSCFVTCIVQ